jgi:hypothetical protein
LTQIARPIPAATTPINIIVRPECPFKADWYSQMAGSVIIAKAMDRRVKRYLFRKEMSSFIGK